MYDQERKFPPYLMQCIFLATIVGKSTSKNFLGKRFSSWIPQKKQKHVFAL